MKRLENIFFKYGGWWAILLSLPAAASLTVPGFWGASDDLHIAWLYEMNRTLASGQIPPRFVPDLSFGFGYPLFNFVFPLPFYLGEVFHFLGLNLVDSIKAVFFLSLSLSSLFMYRLLREFTNRGLSLAGAVIYTFTPYRSTDIYVRGAIGESLAFVFLPLTVLSLVKILNFQGKNSVVNFRWVGIGSLSLAFLILTHNITAYMFLPTLVLLVCLLFFSYGVKNILALLMMLILGLLSSLYFWLPAILDSKLMVYDTVFNFIDHFPTLRQLFVPYWGYGASVPGPGDGMSFFIGVINLLIWLLGGLLLVTYWSKFTTFHKILLIWAETFFLLAVFFMNYRSVFIWQSLPLLPYFQFPWRFLVLTTFMSSFLVVALDKLKWRVALAIFLILVTIILNVGYFRPHDFLGRRDEYYFNRYIPLPVASREYLSLKEEYLRLPKATQQRPGQNYPLVLPKDKRVVSIIEVNALDALITTKAAESFQLDYNKYHFPGWQATVDGLPQQLRPGSPFGQITMMIPPGVHQIEISFRETSFKKALDILSLMGIFLSVIVTTKGRIKYNGKNHG